MVTITMFPTALGPELAVFLVHVEAVLADTDVINHLKT